MRALDSLLDASVVFSFDRFGFRRHARRFVASDLQVSLAGKTVLVTGANSGIGFSASRALAALGASVHLLCRDEGRGRAAVDAIATQLPAARLHLHRLDVSRLADVRRFIEGFERPVDVLVNNAGVLPETLQRTDEGHELTFATNVLGPHALTAGLMPGLLATKGRVVTVTSGGMFTQRLDLAQLTGDVQRFDGVVAYAQTKRAEVILSELWAVKHPDVTFSTMHPGWADTPAVRTSLPTFHRFTRHILRTPDEGADTVVWLAAAARLAGKSGLLWFDREPVSTHPLSFTKESEADREALWALVERAVRGGETPGGA
ncbi:MAG: SDR family NAD(P)-dependent oxidoreductase [Myxococcaceae bacterium]|jgi:dehydrogenase/reductase SDR family protein 12|nr:SDR family NAD(P)-dependent oxidoreductase [Myxococcaceae bacterium]MCA3012639.1 SDR family NAD(P)-dependent oxidoreductase [Myxococcaceae bacterium]